MHIVSETFNKDGGRTVVLKLGKDDLIQVYRDDSFYQLAGQLDMVVPTCVLNDSQEVHWDHIEQKWITA